MKPAEPGKPVADGAFHLASIGHVTPNRNREELIRALPEMLRRGIAPRLMIAGREMTSIPRQLAQSLGVSSHVEFLGEVKQSSLFELLRTVHAEAHLFFIPGLGLATMEAMAFGLPVVAYGYEGMYGDVPFRHGVNIMFANPYDQKSVNEALMLLAENPNLRQAIGKNARELIRDHLTWDVVIEQFRGLYHELI
jgi:glycosyltransferase involved in cell wall biosynthesis